MIVKICASKFAITFVTNLDFFLAGGKKNTENSWNLFRREAILQFFFQIEFTLEKKSRNSTHSFDRARLKCSFFFFFFRTHRQTNKIERILDNFRHSTTRLSKNDSFWGKNRFLAEVAIIAKTGGKFLGFARFKKKAVN